MQDIIPQDDTPLKQCTGCLKTKPLTDFRAHPSGLFGVRSKCKACAGVYQREYYRAHPQKRKEQDPRYSRVHKLKTRFNLTTEQYDEMLKNQQGVCAICGKPETSKTHKGVTLTLSVDHCHQTKIIRELLCQGCNLMLGSAKDDPEILIKGAEYLNRHK